jgi:hypothetical protein
LAPEDRVTRHLIAHLTALAPLVLTAGCLAPDQGAEELEVFVEVELSAAVAEEVARTCPCVLSVDAPSAHHLAVVCDDPSVLEETWSAHQMFGCAREVEVSLSLTPLAEGVAADCGSCGPDETCGLSDTDLAGAPIAVATATAFEDAEGCDSPTTDNLALVLEAP